MVVLRLTRRRRSSTDQRSVAVLLLQTLVLVGLVFLQQKGHVQALEAVEQQSSQHYPPAATRGETQAILDPDTNCASDETMNGPTLHQQHPPQQEQRSGIESIIVVTVDGSLASLDKRTGKVLWKTPGSNGKPADSAGHFATARSKESQTGAISEAPVRLLLAPLVSTTTTVKTASGSDWRTAAVPNIDGNVYLTASTAGGSDSADVTVTTTVQELVARAPFVDTRGRIYTGTRRSTAIAVDGDTGQVLQIVSAENQDQSAKADNKSNPALQNRNMVWIGRVDYSVSIHEPRSGSLDVQFSSSTIMSVNDMVIGSTAHQPWEPAVDHSYLLPTAGTAAAAAPDLSFGNKNGWVAPVLEDSKLVATPNGDVAYRNPDTGDIEWVSEECFDSPVAFAVDSASGASLEVNILPDAIVPNGSADYVSKEIERQLQLSMNTERMENDEQTIVGSLSSGQLYAMPLGIKSDDASRVPSRNTVTTSTSTAAVNSKHQHTSKVPQITGRQHSHFHNEAKAHASLGRKTCTPGSPNFPVCLVGTRGPFARDPKRSFLSESAPRLEENAIVPFYHSDYGYIPLGQAYYKTGQSQGQRKPDRVLRILGNWLAPTIALIFVLSFELGRRKRQEEKLKKEIDARDIVKVASSDSRTTDVGVIHVCDDVILGYGGHGTVVYKGTLEGRQVAVKRMLKAYHASAAREIALLIESDGHPNVVRYFLKEVRGDFVYLALELCDLSLHDLIGMLRQHFDLIEKNKIHAHGTIAAVTKMVLFQIVSGVQHLHHLRILHRDLKPQNILLAEARSTRAKRKETKDEPQFEIFKKGGYIAKISDMGLGKQLVGQSSHGASTLAEFSHNGQSHGAQSSIAGAGPGSVGWQAPEVMALRLPSDASVRSDGSGAFQDSFADASPIDIVTNGRTSRSADIFSLGCIFYSTLVPSSHPFGEWYEREANIMHNRPSLEALRELSLEAYDLVSAMIQRNPSLRPTANQVCEHPFFWQSDRRVAFLCDFSDRLETEALNSESDPSTLFSAILLAVERNAAKVVGNAWDRDLDEALTSNVQRFRTYDPSSIRDLLRLIRNKHHHFDELPSMLKEKIGSSTDGLIAYFHDCFPGLLIHCFHVCRDMLSADDLLSTKYLITSIRRPKAMRLETPLLTVAGESPAPSFVTTAAPTIKVAAATEIISAIIEESEETNESKAPPIQAERMDVQMSIADEDIVSIVIANETGEKPKQVDVQASVATTISNIGDVVVWEGSAAAKRFNCRGWSRSDNDWIRCTDLTLRKRDVNLVKCAEDTKFRTRLCNHWDVSLGSFCPMRKRHKCIFAHGPVELRVKEAKRHRWGKLVDKNGDNKNLNHSGGEDTYGAARSIETMRKEEGKWKTNKNMPNSNGKRNTSTPVESN